ncbi:MAG: PorT family protein [Bacteroidaceae bacterium]|nr:PorT family protein [Bacteroidaceae bacterium]
MKKFAMILAVAALVVAMPSKAENKFQIGIKAQGNLVVNDVNDLKNTNITKGESYSGFSAGVVLKTPSLLGFSLNLSGLYSWNNQKIEDTTIKQNFIDVPLNLRWQFGFKNFGIFLQAGYEFDFNIGSKEYKIESKDAQGVVTEMGDFIANKTRQGANLGLGVMLFGHLEVAANYHWSFGDDSELKDALDNIKDIKLGTQQLQLGVAYYF